MSPSKNRFSVAALIQALECEIARQIETESSEIYSIYTASRRKVLEKIVAELRQVSPGDDAPVFWVRFGSALIAGVKIRTARLRQPMVPAVKMAVLGELAGVRSALGVLRRLVDGRWLQGKKVR